MSATSRQRQPSHEQPTSKAIEPDERLWNSTCRLVGHDWQPTTSDAFRRCIRTGCQAVQRRKGDWWVYAPLKPPSSRGKAGRRGDVEQPSLL